MPVPVGARIVLILLSCAATAHAQQGVGDASPAAAEEPPPEVFKRVKKGIGEYCAALSDEGVADFFHITYQAHRFFVDRSGLPESERKARYESYMSALCTRLSTSHDDIGTAFPYRVIELFMVDISTELCDLEKPVLKRGLADLLRKSGGGDRLDVVKGICRDRAIMRPSSDGMRKSFAAATMGELCLNPEAEGSDERFKPLPPDSLKDALAVCEGRAIGPVDDVASLERLWAGAAPRDEAFGPGADANNTGSTTLVVAVAAVVVALLALVLYRRRRR